jgi:hypothetical protein
VGKPAKFHYNYRDPDEQVEYNTTRPATPEKISAEQQRANDWDQWLLTEQTLHDAWSNSRASPAPLSRRPAGNPQSSPQPPHVSSPTTGRF